MGVLVAISIPIFSSQLEKSREAVDLSNIRAAYAECSADVLTGNGKGYYEAVQAKQTKEGWVSNPDKIAGSLDVKTNAATKNMKAPNTVYVEVSADGTFDIVSTQPSGDDWLDAATVGSTTAGD